MDQDLMVRGYSLRTRKTYLGRVRDFIAYLGVAPDRIGIEHVRAFQLHLIDRKVSWTTFNQAVCAIRFFSHVTLGKLWEVRHLPYHKRGRRLPEILAAEEVAAIIDAAANLRDRAVLMTLYGTGMRLNELLNLRVCDIDSQRMMLRIVQGKGRKDRYVALPAALLFTLREYWKEYRPASVLFPGEEPQRPISSRRLQDMVRQTAKRAGIRKRVTPHALRHAYATHHLEQGTNIREIQLLLGHKHLNTTALYTHVARNTIAATPSPLDSLPGLRKEVRPPRE
jgi:site-specific recombinase XerD